MLPIYAIKRFAISSIKKTTAQMNNLNNEYESEDTDNTLINATSSRKGSVIYWHNITFILGSLRPSQSVIYNHIKQSSAPV